MTDAEIGKALREPCYLDEIHETCGGYKDLIPLLKVLRYKALYTSDGKSRHTSNTDDLGGA